MMAVFQPMLTQGSTKSSLHLIIIINCNVIQLPPVLKGIGWAINSINDSAKFYQKIMKISSYVATIMAIS